MDAGGNGRAGRDQTLHLSPLRAHRGGLAEAVSPPPGISAASIANQHLRFGDPLDAYAWSNPLAYEPLDYRAEVLHRGFTPMSASQALSVGSQASTTRIILPELGIDSGVSELAIIDLADSRAYETPVNTVGHIPETANAGEAGSSWFFGHLESPVAGEGSVFFHNVLLGRCDERNSKLYT